MIRICSLARLNDTVATTGARHVVTLLRDIVVPRRVGELRMKGLPYLLDYVLPNFYFHVTALYAILRHNGVDVGKADFLGKFD